MTDRPISNYNRRKYLPKAVKFYCNSNDIKGYFNFIMDKRYVRDYGDTKSKFLSVWFLPHNM